VKIVLAVSGKILFKLEELYNSEKVKKPNLSFASFISESALIELERRNILREAQQISIVGFGDDSVILKDVRKKDRLIEVQIRNRRLKCISDDNFDCIHVGFALALPEVRKVLNK
jgi:ferredoxin-fold anticodon binding domain-containing protein